MIGKSRNLNINTKFFNNYKKEQDSRVRRAYLISLGEIIENRNDLYNRNEIETFLRQVIENTTSYYESAEAIKTLSKLLPPERIYKSLSIYLNKDSHNDIITRSVLESLKKSDSPAVLEIFLHYADLSSSARVRNEAIKGLEKFINDNRVIEFLSKILFDNIRSTQRTILEIIAKSGNQAFEPVLNELLFRSNDRYFKQNITEVLNLLQK